MSPGGKAVAISQSNYIPWKGYFDLIRSVDEFILYDDMQFTRRDWRNRNVIKTPTGPLWLTIPVENKGKYLQKIKETRVVDPKWAKDHWKSIAQSYRKAEFFHQFSDLFEDLYQKAESLELLSQINRHFIDAICGILGIKTKISWSMDYSLVDGKTERLVGLCEGTKATRYLSGPAAKDYIAPEQFKKAGIDLVFADYSGYPPYRQLSGEFIHSVSILDLVFNEGPEALRFMKLL